jgi:uncharacterized protein YijF (DUF1287 family)
MKRIIAILLITVCVTSLAIYLVGYHGPREFSRSDNLPQVENVIKNARKLLGAPYDPLMGMYGNIGAKVGFIVCSDIPNIAFGLSDYSWKEALEKDYKENSKFYNSSEGNVPGNPYFHRRARNLHSYFDANNRLKLGSYKPNIGDMVFYRKSKNGYVAHVALVSEITTNGYKIIESAPKTFFAQEVDQDSPIERGWIFSGFGSVYN